MKVHRNGKRVVLAITLVFLGVGILAGDGMLRSAQAQVADPKAVAEQVYRKLPDLPLENTYLRAKSQKPATDSTLVSRLIHYHTMIKSRSPLYRFDWKITLADYLGMNETVLPDTYPSRTFLTKNPIQGDLQAIRQLTRQQRSGLVQALSDLYASQLTPTVEAKPSLMPQPSAPSNQRSEQPLPSLPTRPQLSPLPVKGGRGAVAIAHP
ncbi:MAG: hypothetical protein HC792_04220 [Acaryochloridaceae cyanobacterium CSU_5_19]|nr:hypothetical protein [Acaryochloridaceae cyanobacterium CSU_5_19]